MLNSLKTLSLKIWHFFLLLYFEYYVFLLSFKTTFHIANIKNCMQFAQKALFSLLRMINYFTSQCKIAQKSLHVHHNKVEVGNKPPVMATLQILFKFIYILYMTNKI